jgi:hypothetical protein
VRALHETATKASAKQRTSIIGIAQRVPDPTRGAGFTVRLRGNRT